MRGGVSLILFFVFLSCGKAEYITPADISSVISSEKTVIIDLRNEKKFADGHIKGAINAEYHEATFLRDIKNIDKERTVILYCGEGIKSDKAADIMKKEGFRNIKILSGGYARWLSEGFHGEK